MCTLSPMPAARGTIAPTTPDSFVEVRGQDGRLYARFDPVRLLLEVRKGLRIEVIDLKVLGARAALPAS